MSFTLDDRAALRRAFYNLTGTASGDDALEEHDSESNETVHRALQYGLWNAQRYLLGVGLRSRWTSTSSALSFTTNTDETKQVALPSDFLRLAGDERYSALHEANGARWGQLVPEETLQDRRGNYYTLVDEVIKVARGASLPTALYADYHHRHATLSADDTAIDFPVEIRPLIVAEAAMIAKDESWLPGGPEMTQKITDNWAFWRGESAKAARRTRQPMMNRPKKVIGSHWFA